MIEEWMYWTRGLAFHFEADGAGWKLKRHQQILNRTHKISLRKQETAAEDKQHSQNEPNETSPQT